MGVYFKQGRIMEDLSSHPNTIVAEGRYAFRVGAIPIQSPYLNDTDKHLLWLEGFWSAREDEVKKHRLTIEQLSKVRRQLDTATENIDYLRSRLSNYEDPDIGTYDHKDRMIRDIERGW